MKVDLERAAPPHPTLTQHYASDAERQRYVNALFERAAPHYERACRLLFPAVLPGQYYRRQALQRAGLRASMKVLDVATGTGLLARSAASIVSAGVGGQVVGLDPSGGMLRESRRSHALPLIQGVGESLPLGEESFDFLCMGYALRHVSDLEVAFREYHRVLRPGGRLLLLDVSYPRTRIGRGLAHLYFERFVPLVTRLGTRSPDTERLMRYFWDTIAGCVPAGRIVEALQRSGFEEIRHRTSFGIFSEFTARRR